MLSDLRASRISRIGLGLVALGMGAGCVQSPVRAVVDIAPPALSHDLSFETALAQQGPDAPSADSEEEPRFALEMSDAILRVQLSVASELAASGPVASNLRAGHALSSEVIGAGITQLDPELGPMDLGYPLLVDLGAGEAPYDDGVRTIHSVELTRGGFSDSVLQAAWRESITRNSLLHVTVAFSRYQDLGILDGLEDTEFSWCVLGWKTSL